MPAGNTLGKGVLAQIRLGDGLATQVRPLTNAMGLSYTISSSQKAQSCPLTYSIQVGNVAPMLLYYLIAPGGAFAINGDATIVAPDVAQHVPRPVTARTLIAEPLLQGYKSMNWNYQVLQLAEYSQLLSYYNPQSPVVLLTYPDETGTWQQCEAVMHPPQYGSQKTLYYYDVVLTFTRLT